MVHPLMTGVRIGRLRLLRSGRESQHQSQGQGQTGRSHGCSFLAVVCAASPSAISTSFAGAASP